MSLRSHPLIRESLPFAKPFDRTAWRQTLVILGLFTATLATLYAGRAAAWRWALIPVLSACFIRMFVLFHDCGHSSLFSTERANAVIGRLFAYFTSIPFEGWRTEHAWHHRNQGRLDRRGIDRMNSPMTTPEADADPAAARRRAGMISARNVFVLGAYSLLVERKRLKGFFPFRKKFRWPVPNRDAIANDLRTTIVVHVALQAVFFAAFGWLTWLTVLLPAIFLAAGVGAWLFWVQHNFPRTYHADRDDWSYVDVALHGSSYLALPRIFAWITCNIGLHHVHHLNPRIPNYRLDEARRAIPALDSVRPLSFADLRACFTRVFWEPRARRMIGIEQLSRGGEDSR